VGGLAKGAAPSRGSIERAPGSWIVADDEENFTTLKFSCHKKITTNNIKIYTIFACKRNY
jgi:hypothetical protein